MTNITPPPSSHAPSAIAAGIRRALPIVLGYTPVAFAFGVLAVQNNIPPGLAVLMSVFLFAGSGQFVAVSLWGAGASVASIVLMVFVVNLRHLLMSASLAAYLKPLKRWHKFLFGYELTDEVFAVHITALQQGWQVVVPTLFACNVTVHVSWVVGTILGVLLGSMVTDVRPLGLDYALIAMFLALLVPQCRERLHVLVALVALVLSVSLRMAGLGQWNIIVATVAAAMLGAYLLGKKEQKA